MSTYFPWYEYKKYMKLVENDGLELANAPLEIISSEMIITAVIQCGLALRHVPFHMMTYDIVSTAVQCNANAIRYVPEAFLSADLCEIAVDQDPMMIKCIPKKYCPNWLSTKVVRANVLMIEHIPYLTKELCEIAVKQYAPAILLLPKKYQTNELYLMAVKKDTTMFPSAPKTKEICMYIALEHPDYAHRIPKQNKAFYQEVFDKTGNLLIVPRQYRTKSMCLSTVKQNGLALEHVPKKCWSTTLFTIAVKQNGLALEYVPKKYWSIILFTLAVRQNGLAIKYVPQKYRTKKICDIALRDTPYAYEYIDNLTDKMIIDILKRDGKIIRYLRRVITEEMYYAALLSEPLYIAYAPTCMKTKRVCSAALCDFRSRNEDDMIGLELPTIHHKWCNERQKVCEIYMKSNLQMKKFCDMLLICNE
jgi:hypothetical protein